jgi:hypothetical protein
VAVLGRQVPTAAEIVVRPRAAFVLPRIAVAPAALVLLPVLMIAPLGVAVATAIMSVASVASISGPLGKRHAAACQRYGHDGGNGCAYLHDWLHRELPYRACLAPFTSGEAMGAGWYER